MLKVAKSDTFCENSISWFLLVKFLSYMTIDFNDTLEICDQSDQAILRIIFMELTPT